MRKLFTALFYASVASTAIAHHFPFAAATEDAPLLIARAHTQRLSVTDLEIGGDIAGLPPGSTRFVPREDLLALPQVSYTVTDDPNFTGPTEISGVPLEDLDRSLAGVPDADLVIAICDDQYRAHYTRAYLAAHQPLLVLKVNGQPPELWPKDAEGHDQDMGPYMISLRQFTPAFKVLAHQDEPQIPWGVVRLEFRNEKAVFGGIAPHGPAASDSSVQVGYRIAQQNCFRCHNQGGEGGLKARHPWLVLSAWATASPEHFAAYVRNPRSETPYAQMPPNPGYDPATLQALIAYFRTFQAPEKP
jgi:mono/diheme cytochrome c family protein